MFEFHQILMKENDRQNILIGQQNALIGQLVKNEIQITKESFAQKEKEGKIQNKYDKLHGIGDM